MHAHLVMTTALAGLLMAGLTWMPPADAWVGPGLVPTARHHPFQG